MLAVCEQWEQSHAAASVLLRVQWVLPPMRGWLHAQPNLHSRCLWPRSWCSQTPAWKPHRHQCPWAHRVPLCSWARLRVDLALAAASSPTLAQTLSSVLGCWQDLNGNKSHLPSPSPSSNASTPLQRCRLHHFSKYSSSPPMPLITLFQLTDLNHWTHLSCTNVLLIGSGWLAAISSARRLWAFICSGLVSFISSPPQCHRGPFTLSVSTHLKGTQIHFLHCLVSTTHWRESYLIHSTLPRKINDCLHYYPTISILK